MTKKKKRAKTVKGGSGAGKSYVEGDMRAETPIAAPVEEAQGKKKCPECGIYNEMEALDCNVCDAVFPVEEGESKERGYPAEEGKMEGDDLGKEMWRLNKDLMVAISEQDEETIADIQALILTAVYGSDGRFVQDEEGYGKEVIATKKEVQDIEADLEHEETGGPVSPKMEVQIGDPEAVVEVEVSEEVREAVIGVEPTVLEFTREKETTNTVRFKEIVELGRAPVIGALYVQKWWIQGAVKVTITIAKVEP